MVQLARQPCQFGVKSANATATLEFSRFALAYITNLREKQRRFRNANRSPKFRAAPH
jgi:hypothetical protein